MFPPFPAGLEVYKGYGFHGGIKIIIEHRDPAIVLLTR